MSTICSICSIRQRLTSYRMVTSI